MSLENNWIILDKEIDIYKIKKTSKVIDFSCPITINDFINFKKIKKDLVDCINLEKNIKKEYISDSTLNISKSDFYNSKDFSRNWFKILEDNLVDSLLRLCVDSGYNGFQLKNIWFQQYEKGSEHGWHIHGGTNYSGVFYVEMPNGSPKTEFFNTITQKTFYLEMNEGQIAIFPSFALHRSSINMNEGKKTIVSFNLDLSIQEGM